MAETGAKLIQMPNRLKDRLSGSAEGLSFEEILAKSAAIVLRLSGEWRIGALHDVAALTKIAGEMHRDPAEIDSLLPAFFSIAHGIQGQAGTFGYSAVGDAASALCSHLADIDAAFGNLDEPRRHLAAFDMHLARLRRLLLDDVRDAEDIVDLRQAG